jgi:hypothetical protein
MIDKEAAARVMVIIRKVFPASGITLEQEKRFLPLIRKAQSEDAALEAIDVMFAEGVRYPTGFDYRTALDRIHQKRALQEHLAPVPEGITFTAWYTAQDDDMKARVRRVFPSLKVELAP